MHIRTNPHFVPSPPPPKIWCKMNQQKSGYYVPKNAPKCTRKPPAGGCFEHFERFVFGAFGAFLGGFFGTSSGVGLVPSRMFFGMIGGVLVHFSGGLWYIVDTVWFN